jgi:DNA-binding NtrC family response regulator
MSKTLQPVKARFGIVGNSPLLDMALETATRVAPTDLTVLITGESGVGKEVFSKIIHGNSSRKHNEFIAVNCGAIPEGTINSELFGHEKGSFTGAVGDRKGYFETVNGGTIFLDEIAELPLDTQAFLLRVLESGEFIRVGASKSLKTDVRVIAATNVDLLERVRKGKFREDLYYRLSTVPIKVPALHERREDIALLFRKFAHDFAEKYRMQPIKLDEQAALLFENYRWPGNIRELKNVAEQLSVLSENRTISAHDIQTQMPQIRTRNLPVPSNQANQQELQEREILYKVLFDMKNDLYELKSMFFELVKSNNLRMPEPTNYRPLPPSFESEFAPPTAVPPVHENAVYYADQGSQRTTSIIIDAGKSNMAITRSEEAETPLAMDDIEKEAIRKSLKKYQGRRKEAAEELKISERTLYRKIRQYDLD